MKPGRVPIIQMQRHRLSVPLIAGFLAGCLFLWVGATGALIGSESSFGIPAVVQRSLLTACGTIFVVAIALLVLSNVVQNRAILVGTSRGLQVIYPLGLHRLMSRSRLEGPLRRVTLRVLKQTSGSRLQPPLSYLRITALEGTLNFSFATRAVNTDFRERFADWAATRQSKQLPE